MKTQTQTATLLDAVSVPSILTGAQVRLDERLVNRSELLLVLDRAAGDPGFIAAVADRGSAGLRNYDLTLPEKAALISGDIRWIEDHVGRLTERQCTLLDCMLQREAW